MEGLELSQASHAGASNRRLPYEIGLCRQEASARAPRLYVLTNVFEPFVAMPAFASFLVSILENTKTLLGKTGSAGMRVVSNTWTGLRKDFCPRQVS